MGDTIRSNAPCGTTTRFQAGCRCDRCSTDHRLVKHIWKAEHLGMGLYESSDERAYKYREPAGDWTEQAACKNADPALFYANSDSTDNVAADRAKAKQICQSCPSIDQCLQHAIDTDERWGIWGGMEPLERERWNAGLRRSCPICGTLFPPKTNQKYCSKACYEQNRLRNGK